VAGRWEHFHHEADIGVRGYGASMDEAFEQAALALAGVVTDPASVKPLDPVSIRCEAPDPEILLVDWLGSVIYEMSVRKVVFGRFEVRIAGRELIGAAWGEPVDIRRHQPAVEVKAATYAELRVAREGDGWVAQCVVDV
jgi:SHS2 domain-containing protein